jgi:glycosyltransferase involved in cell wall biosynthesis
MFDWIRVRMNASLRKPLGTGSHRSRPGLRICLVTCFPPSRGDLNEYGFHLASALRSHTEVELTILADEIADRKEIDGFNVERCWRFNSLFTLPRLLSAIQKVKPDVVWFNMGFSTFARSPLAALLSITSPAMARALGFYTHVTLHTLFERINLKDSGVRMEHAYKLGGHIATRVLLGANDVSVLLPSFRAELIHKYGVDASRVHFQPHGTFSAGSTTGRLYRARRKRIILAFGYWGTYKRVDLLLRSFCAASEELLHLRLLIAGLTHPGNPGYLESLHAQYADRLDIKFLGYVREDDVPDLFRRADLVVLPYSSAAGTSGVVHQACEWGVPMLAADIPEMQELAREHGMAIEFYPKGDGAALTQQLIRILKSDQLRKSMARQNFLVGANMHMSRIVDRYLELFQARTQGRRNGAATEESLRRTDLEQSVGEWILHSGIEKASGGVARYHLSKRKRNKPVSTEITAYCASCLTVLHERTADQKYLHGGRRHAHFLAYQAWDAKSSALPFGVEGVGRGYSYFFDDGIVVRGLLAVWRKTGDPELLAAALRCGETMARDFIEGEIVHPIIILPDKKAVPQEMGRWSRSSGCYQLKAAMGWCELWETTGNARYKMLYENCLGLCLASHNTFLPGSESEDKVMDRLHAYAYFLEGLLPSIAEAKCREAMRQGIPRLAQYMTSIAPRFLRSDVVAQLLRLRIYADVSGVVLLNARIAAEEAWLIRKFQSNDSDPRLRGGFWFGRKLGRTLPCMNPASTVFCYQALGMWDRYQNGERDFHWHNLI